MAAEQIRTFESWFGVAEHELVAFANPSASGERTPPSGRVRETPRAQARVNHGRWIVDCPLCAGGAELLNRTTGLFFCCGCRNAEAGHDLLRVEFPDEREAARIERALLARPEANRNWEPGESVSALRRESRARL